MPKMPCLECIDFDTAKCPKGCEKFRNSEWAKVMSERLDNIQVGKIDSLPRKEVG